MAKKVAKVVTEAEFREKLEQFSKLFKKEFPKVYGNFHDKASRNGWVLHDEVYKKLESMFGDKFWKMVNGADGYNAKLAVNIFITYGTKLKKEIDNTLKISSGNLKINDQNVEELYEFLEWASDYKDKCSKEFQELFDFFEGVKKIEN